MGICLHLRSERLRSSVRRRAPAVPPRAQKQRRRRRTGRLQARKGRRTGLLQDLHAGRHAPRQPNGRPGTVRPVHLRPYGLHDPPQGREDVCAHPRGHDLGPLLVFEQLLFPPVPEHRQQPDQESADLPHHGQP